MSVVSIIATGFAISIAINAADTKKNEPIKVYARTIEIDDRTGTALYLGDVSLTDGILSIKADKIEAKFVEGEIETFHAYGKPITVDNRPEEVEQEMHATADRLKYYVKSRKLDLFGDVTLLQGESELRCPEMHYDLDARRFLGKGGRCFISIQPKDRSNDGTEES
ncbi:MAG: lipopolysaccharide transport periplasmic protein LptA [Acidiferrobacterales bacterium]